MVCPDCDGNGKCDAFFLRMSNGSCVPHRRIKCLRCKGECTVPDEMKEWIEAGKRLKQDRLSRGMGLRQESERLGCKASDLSARELGKVKP